MLFTIQIHQQEQENYKKSTITTFCDDCDPKIAQNVTQSKIAVVYWLWKTAY